MAGEAKRRGTFEERKAAAILRDEENRRKAEQRRLERPIKSGPPSKLAAFAMAAMAVAPRWSR